MASIGLLQNIDSIHIPVPDLETGLKFYSDLLGHELVWRPYDQAALRMPDSQFEIILGLPIKAPEVAFHAASAERSAQRFAELGGTVLGETYEISNGQGVIVRNPFGNSFRIHDSMFGELITDKEENILGAEADFTTSA